LSINNHLQLPHQSNTFKIHTISLEIGKDYCFTLANSFEDKNDIIF